MYRAAIQSIVSELVRQERLVVVESVACEQPKTKELLGKLNELNLENVLIVSEDVEQNLYLAARNLVGVEVLDSAGIDPVSLIAHDKVLVTVAALKKIEETLA